MAFEIILINFALLFSATTVRNQNEGGAVGAEII